MTSSYPFRYNLELEDIVFKLTKDSDSDKSSFRKIYGWISNNIDYDHKLGGRIDDIEKNNLSGEEGTFRLRDSLEVFEQQQGICSEQSLLMITMARLGGIRAKYVEVKEDVFGEKISHVCCGVDIDGKFILADSTYGAFDVDHKQYMICDGNEIVKRFRVTNNKYNPITNLLTNNGYDPRLVGPGRKKNYLENWKFPKVDFKKLILPTALVVGSLFLIGAYKIGFDVVNKYKETSATVEYILNK